MFPNCKIYVRRTPKIGLEEKYLSKTTKFGGKKLMIWGFITYDSRKGLAKITENVTSNYYIQILQENLLPNMNLSEVSQQDNAPAHNPFGTKVWMAQNAVDFLENWPAQVYGKTQYGTKLRPNIHQTTLFYIISMGGHRKNNKILTKH